MYVLRNTFHQKVGISRLNAVVVFNYAIVIESMFLVEMHSILIVHLHVQVHWVDLIVVIAKFVHVVYEFGSNPDSANSFCKKNWTSFHWK